jgi:hypothetical protein
MFDEKICLENLQRIVSETANDQNIKKLSTDAFRSTYEEIGDNIFQLSVFNCYKFKNMLWNFDNLKPEVRSNFQKKCFDAWHSVYLKSASRVLSEENDEDPIKIEIEASTDKPEHEDPNPAVYFEKRDWFDKLLDFAAAIVYAFAGVFGR